MPKIITAKYLYVNGKCLGRFEYLTKVEIEKSCTELCFDNFEVFEIKEESRYKTDIEGAQ